MDERLFAYLKRINFQGVPTPDLETLVTIHRQHLFSIPYENLDIHRGLYMPLDEDNFFNKLVTNRRGGWCYEMNGLLSRMLRLIGFEVELMSATVNRRQNSEKDAADHLILLVQLEQPCLVDVGFGNGFLDPVPLEVGAFEQHGLQFRLDYQDPYWMFDNHVHGGAGFDFTLETHPLSYFSSRCHYLQTSPESGFVRTTVCHRFTPQSVLTLRGALLRTVTAQEVSEQTIESGDQYRQVLGDVFDLHLDDTDQLWQHVWKRHQEWLQQVQ
ncbi:MAG: arylamine N-acetyltransferase [Anaerolineae bacterium]